MKTRPLLLLVLGALALVAANLRGGIGVVAWLAPVPLLHYLRLTSGVRSRAALALVLVAAWTLATLKIVTPPVPAVGALGYGLPLGLAFLVPYLAWDGLRRRRDDATTTLAFPALMVIVEWALARLTPMGSWGMAAYTQLDDLPLLQMASLLGAVGVSFVVHFVGAAIERAWVTPVERPRWLVAIGAIVVATHAFGSLRLARPWSARTVRAATVGTDATFGGLPLPSKAERAAIDDALFTRTRAAARGGAALVVWNEGATLVLPEEQVAFRARAAQVAREEKIELVIAFIVPTSLEPLRYENTYVWLRPDGSVDHDYLKHEPVPGEPAVRGYGSAPVVSTAFGRMSGAICYDYDFPYIAQRHASSGVDLVALPSSDWLGIDPLHTQMASLRAIEGGFSIVRSTRMGLSAGIDPRGRLRSWQSSWESADRIMLVTLPAERTTTVYSVIGDALVWACIAFVSFVAARSLRSPQAPLIAARSAPR